MNLDKIDLTNLVAIGHDNEKLALLIDRGDNMEYVEVRAPKAAYDGLQEVAAIASDKIPVLEENTENSTFFVQATRSHCTAAIGYNPQQELLQVEFVNGAVYQYEEVEPETWEDFCETESPGRFYNSEIKGLYYSKRIV
ncbi:MAG: KTSC domain-containing protein [Cyanobacteria bacterium SBLK]|nr:KTSC domain-containing protein [Cyanobacteria bacterium SBLK]